MRLKRWFAPQNYVLVQLILSRRFQQTTCFSQHHKKQAFLQSPPSPPLQSPPPPRTASIPPYSSLSMMNRKTFATRVASVASLVSYLFFVVGMQSPLSASAFSMAPRPPPTFSSTSTGVASPNASSNQQQQQQVPSSLRQPVATVAYKPLSIVMNDFGGIEVPVACWFPILDSTAAPTTMPPYYAHQISIRRIGQLLAGWDFLPEWASRRFQLAPTITTTTATTNIADGTNLPLFTTTANQQPIILLAHGYLGSRFDLSHLAEALAAEGFVCLAMEYPESLAASYDRVAGLDRKVLTAELLRVMEQEWKMVAPTIKTRFGIVGHSLGCGTVLQTGNNEWTRVMIAGGIPPADPNQKILYVASMNDGAVSLARFGGKSAIPPQYMLLQDTLDNRVLQSLPPRDQKLPNQVAVIFDRPDAPNHISFLSETVNNAMIDLLSPLLPLAQALSIPVLDFDRYKESQDSAATAATLHPIIIRYLKEQMMQENSLN